MDGPILVTGGTGTLGRIVVQRLLDTGQPVRVTSRRPRPAGDGAQLGWAVADLRSGRGVEEAVAGAAAVVHCATAFGRGAELELATTVVRAATQAGSPHLVYVSIVGVDRVPLGYYRGKLAAERLIEHSGLPYTILRATQFHELIRVLFAAAAKAPLMLVPAIQLQPIAAAEVAGRLAELALSGPVGHAADIGGPQIRDARDLAHGYLAATGRRRPVLRLRWPGRVYRAYRQGGNLTPQHAVGTMTFEEYLAQHPDPRRVSYRGRR